MDELLAYVRGLLIADSELLAYFQACGATDVTATTERGQTGVTYPRIVQTKSDGAFRSSGDHLSKFRRGRLTVETFAKRSDSCPQPYAYCQAIGNRVEELLLGVPGASQAPLVNVTVGPWRVCCCDGTQPSGDVNDPDPLIFRRLLSLDVLLNRLPAPAAPPA